MGSQLQAGGREKEVPGLGSSSVSPEAEVFDPTCLWLCTPGPQWDSLHACTPFLLSPGGNPAWGPPALAHVAPLSPSQCTLQLEPHSQRHFWYFWQGWGNLHGPSLPTGQVGVTKRELLCAWQQVPKNPAQVSGKGGRADWGRGAGGSCAAILLQGMKCRADPAPNASPAPADPLQPVSQLNMLGWLQIHAAFWDRNPGWAGRNPALSPVHLTYCSLWHCGRGNPVAKKWQGLGPSMCNSRESNVQHALPQQSHQLLFSSSSGRMDVWYSESIPDKPLRFYYATFYGIVLDKNGDLSNTMLLTL